MLGLGATALGSLLNAEEPRRNKRDGLKGLPHMPSKARRVIYLFQSGGPSQLDLFDHKPNLAERFGEDTPKSVYPDERKTTMTSGQTFVSRGAQFVENSPNTESPASGSAKPLRHLAGGHRRRVRDQEHAHREAINHDPASTLFQTGSVIPGRPSMGAWVSYALGQRENANLPAFVALTSNGTAKAGQPFVRSSLGSGILAGTFPGSQVPGPRRSDPRPLQSRRSNPRPATPNA